MLDLVVGFRALEEQVRKTSNAKKDQFVKRKQLLPRERVALLLDRGSPFLELSTLAGLAMHDDDGKENVYGGGNIIGIGYVEGVRCLISASDSAIKGGTTAPMGLKKKLRSQEITLQNKLPTIHLVESGGANLNYQAQIFVEGGQTFRNQARLSAAGISAGQCGARLVHRRRGLSAGAFRLCRDGARAREGVSCGSAALARRDRARSRPTSSSAAPTCIPPCRGCRTISRPTMPTASALRARSWRGCAGTTRCRRSPARTYREPRYDPDELCGVVPVDYRKPYEVREVIARLIDESDFLDFKPLYGPHTVCGSEIEGHACAIIANNGPIDADGAAKAGQFIQLMCQSGTPIIYLQNTTGYMVGTDAERGGIVKHGSKMIQAVSNATVPQLTLHIGASFGAGNYGMCGRSFDPRFIFACPTTASR